MTQVKIPLACSACSKQIEVKPTSKGNARPPAGWKRVGEAVYCRDCKGKLYKVQALTLPVKDVDGDWKEFVAAVYQHIRAAVRLANWSTRQLAVRDTDRAEGQAKLHTPPALYLYGLWNESEFRADWPGSASAANAVMHAAEAKYRARRYETVWLNQASLPRYQRCPYPIQAKECKVAWEETDGGRVPVVNVPLGGKRWMIRLRLSPYHRAAFAALIDGAAIQGEAAIYLKRAGASHRRDAEQRKPGGGQRTKWRIMVKLVAHQPRGERSPRDAKGVLEVRTGSRCLLVAVSPHRDKPWLFHADQLRRLTARHEKQWRAIGDDCKAEYRPAGEPLKDRLNQQSYRYHARMDSELRRIAAALVGFAARSRLAVIAYDDAEHRYCPGLPWAKLKEYIGQAADKRGITIETKAASAEVIDESLGAARGDEVKGDTDASS